MEKTQDLDRLTQRLELATRAARIAIWEWDVNTDALYWSPVFFDILGLDPQAFSGQVSEFFDRVVPADRDRVRAALEAHLDHGTPYEIEFEMVHADGSRVAIAATGQAARNSQGRPLRMVGTVQDISDRRRIEDKLLRAERIARIGHWDVDLATNTLTWSPEIFRIHGLDPAGPQPTVKEAFAFYHPDDVHRVREAFSDVSTSGQLRAVNARLKLDSGEVRHVYADGVATLSEEGQPLQLFGILHDRTEFVKNEEQLNRAQRLDAIGQLAGGIAHDFNNLLAVIHGNLELLLEDEDSREMSADERLSTVTSAMAAARNGAELTRNILAFASRSQLEPRHVSVEDLVEETKSWLGRMVPTNIEFVARLEAGPHRVRLDPSGFQSALVNIVVNARDAMPDGGRLTIETQTRHFNEDDLQGLGKELAPGPFVAIAVTDTGKGIDPDLLKRVFEPFVTTKGPSTGTGLGLSMVQGFVNQSGGFARIYSEVGVGTCVQLFFPLVSSADPDPGAGEDGTTGPRAEAGARILVAEDELEVLSVLVRILTSAGYEVEAAPSGDAAFELFQQMQPFDLLLTDVVMPGEMSGPLLAEACRKIAPDLPVIFLSGYSSEALARGRRVQPEETRLMKPVPKSELLAAVARVLS